MNYKRSIFAETAIQDKGNMYFRAGWLLFHSRVILSLLFDEKLYIQMEAIGRDTGVKILAVADYCTRPRQTRVSFYRDDAFAALNESSIFATAEGYGLISMCVVLPLLSRDGNARRDGASTRPYTPASTIFASRARRPSRQPDTFSCAYCYDSHSRPSPTDSLLNTFSLFYPVPFHRFV